MSEIVVVDDLSFEVRRSDRRTTVGLTIDRGGELVLSVPSDCPTETARQIAMLPRGPTWARWPRAWPPMGDGA